MGAFLLASCSNSPQDLAEKGVEKYLSNEYKTYKSVSFEELDTISIKTDSAYIVANDSLKYFKEKLSETGDQFALADAQQNAKRFTEIVESKEWFYKGKKYKITHTYLTDGGGVVTKDFYLNSGYVVVPN